MTRTEIQALLTVIRYEDWLFHLGGEGSCLFLQVRFTADGQSQHGRKWLLSPHMTPSELVQTAFKAVLTAQEHEVRERFRFRGRTIFGPHFDVDALVELCDRSALDVRTGGAA
ncbi:hypothetical protein [Corallococcus sp. AS-1-6]|uniref:hypothetical protein n=1 Tax=Corallococcus sp. AS-1-6 TaxID=2874599 RepID=UPI001CBC1532|nr:hypothetical protein [Corallococcus sp. AS-1-6]MBZ4373294.1 hypothetical protein [Corallococcus sp. AS-1-6]